MSVSAQVSPRIASAFDRLEQAIARMEKACESQGRKVDVAQLEILQNQIEGLKQDNLALSEALEVYSDADYDTQFEEMTETISSLKNDNALLSTENNSLKERNGDFSARLEKLIGNVQQVLDEEEDD